MSQTFLALLAAVVIISITNRCEGSRLYPCPPPCNTPGCNDPPTDCQHGLYEDFCGRTLCLGGPGDRCGGPSNIMGKCTRGLTCNCERCTGCAMGALDKIYKCYDNEFLCTDINQLF